jgi:NADPH:quinone reductase-like Zn-dependent oxidoreductase
VQTLRDVAEAPRPPTLTALRRRLGAWAERHGTELERMPVLPAGIENRDAAAVWVKPPTASPSSARAAPAVQPAPAQ